MNRSDRPRRLAATLVAGVALLTAACGGNDDGASVRNLGGDASGAGGAASGAAAGESGSSTGEAICSPVGTDLAGKATTTVDLEALDFAFKPATVDVEAGITTFDVKNTGKQNHEVGFLPGGGEVPLADGAPDEQALEKAGAFELEAFGPGTSCAATYDLKPGTYTMFCVIEDPNSGKTHYELGMKGTLVVS